MSDKKISQLPASTTPLAGTEVLPIVQSSTTKQVSVANLTAGRDVAVRTLTASAATGSPILSITRPSLSGLNILADNAGPIFQPTIAEGIQIYNVAGITLRFLFRTNTGNLELSTGNLVIGTAGKGIDFGSSVLWRTGAGSPEGVVTAAVGSLYTRTDGGLLTTLYVKESGAGNTGWVGK
jgi:hypothetical protein